MNFIKYLVTRFVLIFTLIITIIPTFTLFAEENKQIKINWIYGPKQVDIGYIAEIKLLNNYSFANGDDTRKIMELIGNPPTNRELGFIQPSSHKWYLVFEFSEVGYIKDDEKGKLNPDDLLDSIKEGNKAGNEWRKQHNMDELNVIGWFQKPSYDPETNNLEWATLAESNGQKVINYNIRYLGRKGVMEIVLVGDPNDIPAAVKETKTMLKEYNFKQGNKYAEYVSGDKIAEYGLAALVTGGAIAVAAKTGFLAKFWKLILAGLIGIGVLFKKFFAKIFGRKEDPIDYTNRH